MRRRRLMALSLALLLSACAVDPVNEADNGATRANGPAPAPSNGASGQPAPLQPPGNGDQAPEPSGEVTLTAAPAITTGGATMTLTLSNGARERIGYNLCTSALETSSGRPVPANRVCTMELRTLEPGRSADYRYELPVNMADGGYRLLTQIEWMESGRRGSIRSNAFEVR